MELKDLVFVGFVMIVLTLLFIIYDSQNNYEEAISTKDHFANSLRSCLEDRQSLIDEFNQYKDIYFLWNGNKS